MNPTREQRFNAIAGEHRARLARLCRAFVADPDGRMDLLQEILINIWNNLDRFRGDSSIGTWIYRIAVNTALMHLRAEKRRRNRLVELPEGYGETAAEAGADRMELEEQIESLYSNIRRLPEIDRTIILLSLEGFAYADIAEITGLSATNVGARLSRIKTRLLNMMRKEELS